MKIVSSEAVTSDLRADGSPDPTKGDLYAQFYLR